MEMGELVQHRNLALMCPIGRVTEGQGHRERDRTGSSHGYFRESAGGGVKYAVYTAGRTDISLSFVEISKSRRDSQVRSAKSTGLSFENDS